MEAYKQQPDYYKTPAPVTVRVDRIRNEYIDHNYLYHVDSSGKDYATLCGDSYSMRLDLQSKQLFASDVIRGRIVCL